MKKIIIIIMTLGLSFSLMAEELTINCEDRLSATNVSLYDEGIQFERILNIRHNFVGAKLSCPDSIGHSIEESQPFRCAGVWRFDFRRPDNVTGTVVVADFEKNEGQWSVSFVTSHDYQRVKMNLKCTIEVN